MKRFPILLLLLASTAAVSQTKIDPSVQIDWPLITGAGTPAAIGVTCTSTSYGISYQNTAVVPNVRYHCSTDGWELDGGSGGGITLQDVIDLLAAPPAIGGTTPNTGKFTTVISNGNVTVTGETNGALNLTATGTASPDPATNTVQWTVPNSVTSYKVVFPGAAPIVSNNYLSCTNANPSVCSWANGPSLIDGIEGSIPKWLTSTTLGNSGFTDNGTGVYGIGSSYITGDNGIDLTVGSVDNPNNAYYNFIVRNDLTDGCQWVVSDNYSVPRICVDGNGEIHIGTLRYYRNTKVPDASIGPTIVAGSVAGNNLVASLDEEQFVGTTTIASLNDNDPQGVALLQVSCSASATVVSGTPTLTYSLVFTDYGGVARTYTSPSLALTTSSAISTSNMWIDAPKFTMSSTSALNILTTLTGSATYNLRCSAAWIG